jgi:hypothetical protein
MPSKQPNKPTVYPCNVCGIDAIGCYRPDMDIKGLCFCAEHREDVFLVYVLIMQDNMPDTVEDLMKDWKYK